MSGISRILREALRNLLARRTGAASMDMADLGRTVSKGVSESDRDFLAMLGRDGPTPTPEEALGRPLTPDHIWYDPRFKHRYAMTSDLEGVRTPAERFQIAGERINAQVPERLARQRAMSQGPDMESIITMGREMEPSQFADTLGSGLGEYSALDIRKNVPLLGAALTVGGGGLTLREILARRYGERA